MSQTIFQKVDYTLTGLISSIEMGQIGLPDIQRPFVWKNVKVRDLFDSMYRGYPVGYLLFWQNGQVSDRKAIGTESKQLTPSLVIVDGQQRLTSLYAVMKGVPVVRDNYRSERIRIAFNPIEEKFDVTSAAIDRDKTFIPDISRLWSRDTDLFDVADEYIDGLKSVRDVTRTEVRKIRSAIQNLQMLTNFPFTALQLNPEISDEDVAEVFVRINSQGKPLNQADFILTLMSVFWDEGRADLERFCRESRTQSEDGESPYNHFIQPSPDQLLRVGVGLAFRRARLQYVYSILRGKDLESERFSEDLRDAQFAKLRRAQNRVLDLRNWHGFMQCVRGAGYLTGDMISSKNTLMYSYAMYLIGKTDFNLPEHALRAVMSQWFFMCAITGRYTGSSESRLESDLAMLRDAFSGEEFVNRLRRACEISLTGDFWEVTLPNELATSGTSRPRFAYEAALVLHDAPVLFSKLNVSEIMDPASSGISQSAKRQHLFPRKYLRELGVSESRAYNQIANYAYVDWPGDAKISDQAPADYLAPILSRFGAADITTMYRFHALPDGWERMEYQRFLERRRELMAEVIRDSYEKLALDVEIEEKPANLDLTAIINSGESDAVEFKSTLRVNLHTQKNDARMESEVLKTLAGFLNTHGGTLIVGVRDDRTPIGIEADGFASEDKMFLHLTNLVNRRMGEGTWIRIHANFEDHDDIRMLVIRCEKSNVPVYLKEGNDERFYIRTGPSTVPLPMSRLNEYIKDRFASHA